MNDSKRRMNDFRFAALPLLSSRGAVGRGSVNFVPEVDGRVCSVRTALRSVFGLFGEGGHGPDPDRYDECLCLSESTQPCVHRCSATLFTSCPDSVRSSCPPVVFRPWRERTPVAFSDARCARCHRLCVRATCTVTCFNSD